MFASKTAVKKLAAVLLATPLLVVGLSACSASSSSSGHPTSSAGASGSRSDWNVSYAQCMRSQGIDMPDPAPDGTMTAPLAGDKSDAATTYCMDKLGNPPALSGSEQKAADDAAQKELLKIAKCYRDNGVDVPDPTPGGGIKIPTDVSNDLLAQCGGHAGGMAPKQG